MHIQLSQIHFLKRLFFSPLNYLATLVENLLTINGFIYGLSVICLSLCWYHSFDYYSFLVSFKIVSLPALFFLKIVWLYSIYCISHMTFRICLSTSTKKGGGNWDFNRDCIKPIDQFEDCCHLNNIKSSNP